MAYILILDDDIITQDVLGQICEDGGHHVYKAFNGNEGIRICKNKPVDLIITDILMPEKDGIEIIIEMKNNYPKIKMIAISGGGQIEPEVYLKVAKTLGVSHVFIKPLKREEILASIQELAT